MRLAALLVSCLLAIGVGSTGSESTAVAQTNAIGADRVPAVHIVMDVSGSMGEVDPTGRIKLNGAKQAITALLDGLYGSGIPIGLRSYPSGSSDCGPGRLQLDDFTSDYSSVGLASRSLSADGGTPTAEALQAAAQDLLDRRFDDGVIVLVSDGESTCGDPCEAAAAIEQSGIDIRVDTVGFDISEQGREELTCVAEATGGEYRDVADADELATNLADLTTAELALEVEAADVVFTSVGRGSSSSIDVTATVGNPSPNRARRVQVTITPTSERQPFMLQPNRSLGNIDPGGRAPLGDRPITWSFTPPLDFEDIELTFRITASADNADTVSQDITVQLRGQIDLADAGDVLQNREHVVIMGDSYSSGEGAGNYVPGTDTRQNPCHRSPDTYGRDLYPDDFQRTILACSGAVTSNLWWPQHPGAEEAQLTKLKALERAPDLVMLTLGGNDADFGGVIINCIFGTECHEATSVVELSCNSPLLDNGFTRDVREAAAAARGTFESAEAAAFYAARSPLYADDQDCFSNRGSWAQEKVNHAAALAPRLVEAYEAIDAVVNAPRWVDERGGEIAPILVLAYPNPVPDPIRYREVLRRCPATMSFDEWRWAAGEFMPALNAAIASAVRQAEARGLPVRFVSEVEDAFAPSHTICDDDKYINSLNAASLLPTGLEQVGKIGGYLWSFVPGIGDDVYRANQGAGPGERRKNESFHPNASGYRAFTAAIVEWSQSEDGQRPIERSAPRSTIEVREPPDRPPLVVTDSTPNVVLRGVQTRLEIPGLAPGAPLQVHVESRPSAVAGTVVGEDGIGRFDMVLPDNFALGTHSLVYASFSGDGNAIAATVPIVVNEAGHPWEKPALLALAVGLALAGICGLLLVLLGNPRRRSLPIETVVR